MDQLKIGKFIAECRKQKKFNTNAVGRKTEYHRQSNIKVGTRDYNAGHLNYA